MRPILLGIDNPYSKDVAHALLPHPKNCAGWRLWKMINDVSGMTKEEYAAKFDRRNLVDELPIANGSVVVLLGEEVRQAFGLKKLLIHPQVKNKVTYRQVPHPSGRCLFYNDPVMRRLVGIMLEDLCRARPSRTSPSSRRQGRKPSPSGRGRTGTSRKAQRSRSR